MASGEGTSGSAPPVTLGSTASPSSRSESPERTSGTAWSTSRCFFRCEGAASAFLAIFSGCRLMALAEMRVRGGVGGLAALMRDPLRSVLGTTLPAGVLAIRYGEWSSLLEATRLVGGLGERDRRRDLGLGDLHGDGRARRAGSNGANVKRFGSTDERGKGNGSVDHLG